MTRSTRLGDLSHGVDAGDLTRVEILVIRVGSASDASKLYCVWRLAGHRASSDW